MKIKKRKERKVREGFKHHSAKLNVKYGTEAIIQIIYDERTIIFLEINYLSNQMILVNLCQLLCFKVYLKYLFY